MRDLAIAQPKDNTQPVYAYYDVLQVWFRQSLEVTEMRWLDQHCGNVRNGRSLKTAEPAWFNPSYKQTFRLYQASDEALRWLAKRDDVLLTHVELTLDLIRDDADELLCSVARDFVQRWHRKRQTTVFDNGNYRTGKLGEKGTVYQFYADRPSKVTGEWPCFHAEAKVYGSAALRRLGISHPRDLITFDHDVFWRRNLALHEVDRERLGRWWDNKFSKTKRRTSAATKSGYNSDRARGNLLWRVYGSDGFGNHSVQHLVKKLGRGPFLCNGGITFIRPEIGISCQNYRPPKR